MNNEDVNIQWSKAFVAHTNAKEAVGSWAKEVKDSEERREYALVLAAHWVAQAAKENKTAKAARVAVEAARVVEENAIAVLAGFDLK